MPYLGTKGLKASDIRRFNVTSSTSATHTLTWVAPTEQSLIVTINGVKQQEDAYIVSGTTLTLTSALIATDKLEVVGINDVGTTVTPAQNSVNLDKLATTGTASSSTFLRGDMAWTTVSDTSGLANRQVFTSSGTYTKTSGVTKIIVEVQGAGGGSGASEWPYMVGGPGGGGGYANKFIDVSSISSSTITIGAGGAGGSSTGAGSNGGNSIYADGTNTVTGNGGGGGGKASNNSANGNPGSGNTGVGGDFNIEGQRGSMTSPVNPANTINPSANGGSSFYGLGAVQKKYNVPVARSGTGYGAGASANWSNVSQEGADGTDGIVIITEYK